MPIYRAPVEDFRFLFNEVLELEKQRDLPGFADCRPIWWTTSSPMPASSAKKCCSR